MNIFCIRRFFLLANGKTILGPVQHYLLLSMRLAHVKFDVNWTLYTSKVDNFAVYMLMRHRLIVHVTQSMFRLVLLWMYNDGKIESVEIHF